MRTYLILQIQKSSTVNMKSLDNSLYFESDDNGKISNFEALIGPLKQNPNSNELIIPRCHVYWARSFHTDNDSSGVHIDPLFNALDEISSLTTLHINWTDLSHVNRAKFIERSMHNPLLTEINMYQGVFVTTDYGNKPVTNADIASLTRLRQIPENVRAALSDAKIESIIEKKKLGNGEIKSLTELLEEPKVHLIDAYKDSVKQLLEVPVSDEIISLLATHLKSRKTDLKVWFHGHKINEAQVRILSDVISNMNINVSIYAQNFTMIKLKPSFIPNITLAPVIAPTLHNASNEPSGCTLFFSRYKDVSPDNAVESRSRCTII